MDWLSNRMDVFRTGRDLEDDDRRCRLKQGNHWQTRYDDLGRSHACSEL